MGNLLKHQNVYGRVLYRVMARGLSRHFLVLFLAGMSLLSGCAGTLHTRGPGNPNGNIFGKPVYSAVREDYRVTCEGVGHPLGWLFNYNFFKPVSFPLDFVFDTLFLPFDLIGWSMGYYKKGRTGEPGAP